MRYLSKTTLFHHFIQEKTIKAIVREIFVHLLFVLLVQLVCNASLDDNAFWLAENANKFMISNAVTNSYFEVRILRLFLAFGLDIGYLIVGLNNSRSKF